MSNVFPLNFYSNTVRVIVQDGAPWFVLEDIRTAVGAERWKYADRLDEDEKAVAELGTDEGARRVAVVNLSGLYTVVGAGDRAVAKGFKRWITAEILPSILSRGSATVLPPRPPGGVHSTSEIADSLGVHPGTLGRRVKHLRTERHGASRPAVGTGSEAPVERWWWNEAGRDAVLREFTCCRVRPSRSN